MTHALYSPDPTPRQFDCDRLINYVRLRCQSLDLPQRARDMIETFMRGLSAQPLQRRDVLSLACMAIAGLRLRFEPPQDPVPLWTIWIDTTFEEFICIRDLSPDMVEAFGFPDDQGKAGQLFTINLMLQLENSIEEMRAFPIPHPELKDAWLTARETQLPSADREKAFRDAHAQVQAMIVWFAVARKHTRGALCSVYKDMEPTVEDVNSAFVAYFLPLLTERLSWKKGKGGLVLRDHHRPIRDAILKWERDKSTRPQEPDHGEMEWEKIHQAEALDQPAPHEPEEGRTEWSPKWIAPMESASIPIGGNDDNLSMADSKEDDHEATVVDSVLAAEIVEVIREEFGEDGVIVYEGHFATSFPISRPELETLTGITVERQRSLERKIGVLLRHRLGSDLG